MSRPDSRERSLHSEPGVSFNVSKTRRIAEAQRDNSGSVWDVLAYHLLWACDAFENERKRAIDAETRDIREKHTSGVGDH